MLAMTVAVIERGQVKVEPRQDTTRHGKTRQDKSVAHTTRPGSGGKSVQEWGKSVQEWGKCVQFHFNGSANSEVRPSSSSSLSHSHFLDSLD